MVIYLVKNKTNELICTFENVIKWENNFVEYKNGIYKSKVYCNLDEEYFTDQLPKE